MNSQTIYTIKNNNYDIYNDILSKYKNDTIFIVCNKSVVKLDSFNIFLEICNKNNINVYLYNDFFSNPDFSSIINGLNRFINSKSNVVVGFGGGSAIDVAKSIKYYYGYNDDFSDIDNVLKYKYVLNNIDLIAIPTTGGSGSESTSFAVMYIDNIKYSLEHSDILPKYVILDSNNLKSLSDYQKKSTLLDAFAHAFESYWSVNSNDVSKELSKKSMNIIYNNYELYLKNNFNVDLIIEASNIAGQAINISKTTAAHAMSYSLTKKTGISHGHSVSICLKSLIEYVMNNYNSDNCNDNRGYNYLEKNFYDLFVFYNCDDKECFIDKMNKFFDSFNLDIPDITNSELDYLVDSVNVDRLKNNPIKLNKEEIKQIYINSLRK